MKVIIRTKRGYGTREDVFYPQGAEADFSDHLSEKLIRLGIAIPAPVPEPKPKAKSAAVVETAEAAPPENTAKRTSKPKARSSRSPAKKG